MDKIIQLTTLDGQPIELVDKIIGSGAMKDVYFSPDRSYVVALFREPQDPQARERLAMIAGPYREGIFGQIGGDYWEEVFCWPKAVVEHDSKVGVVVPTYAAHFFFEYGSKNHDMLAIRGREKEGKWFASAHNQSRFLDPRERGHWLNYIRICIRLARAVRRLHAAGLAHSDLSYKNALIDPRSGAACLIDLDGLVVPGKFPPDVVGTPDFIAPEVVKTSHLDRHDPARCLPSITTDRHALAVLVYMYLLYRHPLRGDKVHDPDPQRDETLSMGERALFIEHPSDHSNRVRPELARSSELPWKDTRKIPYRVTGPHLSPLFERAFINGLHDPGARPTADDWEHALVKTADLLQPCTNGDCAQGWYVFDNTYTPTCPFCGTPFSGKLPVLTFYSARRGGQFTQDDHRLMVYTDQSLFPWHVRRNLSPNERLSSEERRRVGYFVLHRDVWWLVNERLPQLYDLDQDAPIQIGGRVALTNNQRLLFSRDPDGRLAVVQMVEV
jgi:serine/threonine protein kinase